jgi:hypothetical protein
MVNKLKGRGRAKVVPGFPGWEFDLRLKSLLEASLFLKEP